MDAHVAQDQQQMRIIQEVLLNNNSPLFVHCLNNNFQEILFHIALHLNFDMHDVLYEQHIFIALQKLLMQFLHQKHW